MTERGATLAEIRGVIALMRNMLARNAIETTALSLEIGLIDAETAWAWLVNAEYGLDLDEHNLLDIDKGSEAP